MGAEKTYKPHKEQSMSDGEEQIVKTKWIGIRIKEGQKKASESVVGQ